MVAASYWSLLAPSIEMAETSGLYGSFVFVPVSLGFLGGAMFVYCADLLLPLLVSKYFKYFVFCFYPLIFACVHTHTHAYFILLTNSVT